MSDPQDAEGWAAIPRGLLRDPDVPQGAKLVYAALQSHLNYRSGKAIVRMSVIAEYLAMSRRTVWSHLHWLRTAGIITWDERHVKGAEGVGQLAHEYQLLVAPTFKQVVQDLHNEGRAESAHPLVSKLHTNNKSTKNEKEEHLSAPADVALEDQFDPIVVELTEHLGDWIERNGSSRPSLSKKSLDSCRLMIEIDKREPEKIRTAIDWCQRNEFWRRNIMSMTKLRQHYERLRLQAQSERTSAMPTDDSVDAQRQRLEESRRRAAMIQ